MARTKKMQANSGESWWKLAIITEDGHEQITSFSKSLNDIVL
jgi:hypothetical protein